MKVSECEQCIPIPAYVPKLVAASIGVLVSMVCIVIYCVRERQRHKNFYGKEDQLSKRDDEEEEEAEKQRNLEMDVNAFGGCPDEMVVTASAATKSPAAGGGVKVMVLKKRRILNRTPNVPMSQITPQQIPPESPYQIYLQVLKDKTGRAMELIEVLKTYPTPTGSRTKVTNSVVENVHEILEKMTGKHFVVFGVMEKGRSVMCGQDHMEESVEEMSLQIRLQLIKPFEVKISAYMVDLAVAAAQEVETPAIVTGLEMKQPLEMEKSQKESKRPMSEGAKAYSRIQTDVTPLQELTPKAPSNRKSEKPIPILAETPASANKGQQKSRLSTSALLNAIRNMSRDRKEADSHGHVAPPPSNKDASDVKPIPQRRDSKAASHRRRDSKAGGSHRPPIIQAKVSNQTPRPPPSSRANMAKESQKGRLGTSREAPKMSASKIQPQSSKALKKDHPKKSERTEMMGSKRSMVRVPRGAEGKKSDPGPRVSPVKTLPSKDTPKQSKERQEQRASVGRNSSQRKEQEKSGIKPSQMTSAAMEKTTKNSSRPKSSKGKEVLGEKITL